MAWLYHIEFFYLSILISISLSIFMNYYLLKRIITTHLLSIEQILHDYFKNIQKTTKTCQDNIQLTEFKPLKSYRYFHINETTSMTILNELIVEAKKTCQITIVPHGDGLSSKHTFEIELVQECSSIVIIIQIFPRYYVIYPQIDALLSIVLHSSKMILVWGILNRNFYQYQHYHVFSNDHINRIHPDNIQQSFKKWYNQTFIHNENCDQILDFDDIDGPLCSCSHRPYKNSYDGWSLWNAIAYTFHEDLQDSNQLDNDDNIPICLAVTKLSTIIKEKWTRQQIEDYRQKSSIY